MSKKRALFEIGDIVRQQSLKRYRTNPEIKEEKKSKTSSVDSLIDISHHVRFIDDEEDVKSIGVVDKSNSPVKKLTSKKRNRFYDGSGIYINRLVYYEEDALQDNMITFNQLMSKNLVDEQSLEFQVDVKAAMFTTFEIDEEILLPLHEKKIPTTIFEDKIKRVNPEIFLKNDEFNFNKININKYG